MAIWKCRGLTEDHKDLPTLVLHAPDARAAEERALTQWGRLGYLPDPRTVLAVPAL
jgi:hypothetical protein